MTGSLSARAVARFAAVQDRGKDLGGDRQVADTAGVLTEVGHGQGEDLPGIDGFVDAELEAAGAGAVSGFFLQGLAAAFGLAKGVLTLKVDERLSIFFQGDLGAQLIFLDLALFFDGGCAARVDGHVGLAQERFAIVGFQGLGDLGRGLGRDEVDAQELGARRVEQCAYP